MEQNATAPTRGNKLCASGLLELNTYTTLDLEECDDTHPKQNFGELSPSPEIKPQALDLLSTQSSLYTNSSS